VGKDRSGRIGERDPFRAPRTRHSGSIRRGGPLERVVIGAEEGKKESNGGPSGADAEGLIPPEPDPLGKMALYSGSGEARAPAYGTFLVECSSCKRETPVSPVQLVRAALPLSLHLPLLRRYSSYMRCPACGRRAWLRVTWRM
jgi:hypothetical protein